MSSRKNSLLSKKQSQMMKLLYIVWQEVFQIKCQLNFGLFWQVLTIIFSSMVEIVFIGVNSSPGNFTSLEIEVKKMKRNESRSYTIFFIVAF